MIKVGRTNMINKKLTKERKDMKIRLGSKKTDRFNVSRTTLIQLYYQNNVNNLSKDKIIFRPIKTDQNNCLHEENKPEVFNSIVTGNFTSEYVAEKGNKSVAKQDQTD